MALLRRLLDKSPHFFSLSPTGGLSFDLDLLKKMRLINESLCFRVETGEQKSSFDLLSSLSLLSVAVSALDEDFCCLDGDTLEESRLCVSLV